MSSNADIAIRIASVFDNKGFKSATKQTSALDKGVKKLGASLVAAFTVRAAVNFGKAAVKASLQQQAEQDRLNQLLTVGVGATASQVAALNDQADALEKIGVVTAGNITQTQSQLATFNLQTSTIEALTPAILDYVTAEKGATATTDQFKQMTNGLAQALNGNFTSLTRVGFVIDENTKKQIKSGTESQRAAAIVDVLNSTYKDFNKNLRETPAGQMQVLANAAEDAQTIIGESLIDSLMILSGDTSVEDLAVSMETLATNTSKVITELAKLGKATANFFSQGFNKVDQTANNITDFLDRITGNSERIRRRNVGQARRFFTGSSGVSGGNIETPQERARRIKFENAEKKRLAALQASENKRLNSEKKRLALAKAQLALGKASKTIDLERIGIEAALKNQISKTDRLSLELQLALLDKNESQATKLAGQLSEAVQRQNALNAALLATPEAPNPYRNWKMPDLVMISTPIPAGLIEATTGAFGVGSLTEVPTVPQSGFTNAQNDIIDALKDFARISTQYPEAPEINVQVILDNGVVAGAVSDVQTNNNLSGSFTSVGGRGANTARFT